VSISLRFSGILGSIDRARDRRKPLILQCNREEFSHVPYGLSFSSAGKRRRIEEEEERISGLLVRPVINITTTAQTAVDGRHNDQTAKVLYLKKKKRRRDFWWPDIFARLAMWRKREKLTFSLF